MIMPGGLLRLNNIFCPFSVCITNPSLLWPSILMFVFIKLLTKSSPPNSFTFAIQLGGKVIFLRPENAAYTIYYAHLDSQIVVTGQQVKAGDVLGLTGNTGNAQFTVSHLHFGIYTNNGAIDPLYFVKNDYKDPPKITLPLTNLNTWMRSGKSTKIYSDENAASLNFSILEDNTLVRPEAATANLYRVILPDGKKGFIPSAAITSAIKQPLKRLAVKRSLPLLSTPDDGGLHKKMLVPGDKIIVLAAFKEFYFVSEKDTEGWIAKKEL